MKQPHEHGFLRISVPNFDVSLANPKQNRKRIEEILRQPDQQSCHWVVFPALALTGISCGDLFFQEKLLRESKEQLIELAQASEAWNGMTNIGFPMIWNQKIYACQAIIGRGKIWAVQPQSVLLEESRAFSAWNREVCTTVKIGPWQAPLGIHDFQEEQTGLILRIVQGQEGYTTGNIHKNANPATIYLWAASQEASGNRRERMKIWIEQKSSAGPSIWACSTPGTGESGAEVFYDGYRIVCEAGSTLAETISKNPFFNIIQDVHYRKIFYQQTKKHSQLRTQSELDAGSNSVVTLPLFSAELCQDEVRYAIPKNPWLPQEPKAAAEYCSELFRLQASALARRLQHVGSAYAVLGVSGGLDSTLALLVSVEAFRLLNKGPEQVFAVTMPGFGTSGRTYQNALRLMESLQVTQNEISILPACLQHFEDIQHPVEKKDVVFENSQARERTKILMDLANQRNGLVVGAGDLSEIALGWCTYNGDQMSMYNPNHSLTKTMIQAVIAWYAKTCQNPILRQTLENVLSTPVSPELLPTVDGEIQQKTEEVLGPYEVHDFYLYYMAVIGLPAEDLFYLSQIAFPEYAAEQLSTWLQIFYRRFITQQFKRSATPDGARVSEFSLSPHSDWKMPSDLPVRNWLPELK